jgi:hypothetical protein
LQRDFAVATSVLKGCPHACYVVCISSRRQIAFFGWARVRVTTVKAIAGGIVGLARGLFALFVMIVTDGGDNLEAIGYLHHEMVGQGGGSFQW